MYKVIYTSTRDNKQGFTTFSSKESAQREVSILKKDKGFKNIYIETGKGKKVASTTKKPTGVYYGSSFLSGKPSKFRF